VRQGSRSAIDEPTIITGRPPILPPNLGDSVYRILEGRIMPGDRLGHFELVEFVGGGGMGRVFRALDTQLGRTVAVKVLSPEQSADPDALQRFQNEAQSSARLDHDHIARTYYLGEDRGLHFIVFEFIEGVNIRVLVERKGPLPLAEAVSFTIQVAEALSHADSRAVVHRDIKPSNVLITPEGRVKLIDLGLARLRHADPAVADLTASGVTLGTFDYISPEQARDPRNADIRSDIYSLGCTFFFMLAGQPPFPDGTVLQKLLQHQGDQPPDILQTRPDLPEEVGRILRKMMAKDPRHRYATPPDLLNDLMMLAEDVGLRPMNPSSRVWLTQQEPTVSPVQRHLPWLAPVAALLCIVVLLDRYWSNASRRDDPLPPSIEVAERAPNTSPALIRQDGDHDLSVPKKSTSVPTVPPAKLPEAKKAPSVSSDGTPKNTVEPSAPRDSAVASAATKSGAASGVRKTLPSTPVLPTKKPDKEPSPLVEAVKRSGKLVVCETPQGKEQFATLGAACAAAQNGDVIELRFNGLREDRPMKLANLRVTIQAADGYQPVLAFRPNEADPVKCPRSMISLAGGQVTVVGVAMELQVPRGVPAENWSLLETFGGQTLKLERCVLTIQNRSGQGGAYHQDVAFLRVRSSLGPDGSMVGSSAVPLANVELADSVARGEADFLRVEEMQPVHLVWDNGLLVTSERLLAAEGTSSAPRLDEMLRVELRHVTVEAKNGVCQVVNTATTPYQLTVQFVSSNCIFRTSPGVALITQEGAASVDSFRQRFLWNGERNFYENMDAFWTVRNNLDLEMPSAGMNFDAWKAYWGPSREDQPSTESLLWKRPFRPDQPLHARGPSDYTLEDPTFGDASAGAPGSRVDRLPEALSY
jgi:serine/threonine-protein kinase